MSDQHQEASTPQRQEDHGRPDPGSFIGRKPERVEETIPGGLGSKDERAAAVATQSGPTSPESSSEPSGHRDGPSATDDTLREAGQDR
jgi:hypothetical protein